MRKRFWIGFLLLQIAGLCQAQTAPTPGYVDEKGNFYREGKPIIVAGGTASLPLQCAKYQHEVHIPGHSSGAPCDAYATSCIAISIWHEREDYCADDMHEVTEREWQEIWRRLEAINKTFEIQHQRIDLLEGRGKSK